MNFHYLKLYIFFQFVSMFISAQVSGRIVDPQDNLPIPFVNIGIQNTPIGTASFEDGYFELNLPGEMIEDSLLFSAIGYHSTKIAIKDLSKKDTIFLKQKEMILNQVIVPADKEKFPIITDGITKPNYGFMGMWVDGKYLSSPDGGSALAILINKEGKHVFLEQVEIFIHNNRLNKFNLRIRILSLNEQIPDHDLVNENIIVKSGKNKGKFESRLKWLWNCFESTVCPCR